MVTRCITSGFHDQVVRGQGNGENLESGILERASEGIENPLTGIRLALLQDGIIESRELMKTLILATALTFTSAISIPSENPFAN
jgi:hypothetical protein